MKKYIFTIAFALLGITSSMASKADTLRIYSIDGKHSLTQAPRGR